MHGRWDHYVQVSISRLGRDKTGEGSNYFNTDMRGGDTNLNECLINSITTSHPISLQTQPPQTSAIPPSLPSFSSSLVSKVVTEMECAEAALKSSFRREVVAGKVGLQPFTEEFCGGVVVAPCEDFLVDELFDFSNEEDLVGGIDENDEEKAREQKDGLEGEGVVVPGGSADSVGKEDLPAVQTDELNIPADDLADLEWLSHFVEDSFSGFSSPFPSAVIPGKANFAAQGKEGAKAEVAGVENRVFKTPVHARARRSERPRTGGKGWMLGSPSLSDTSSSSSSSSSSNCITSDTVTLAYVEPSEPPTKKQRKWGNYGSGLGQTAARKCSHCGVQKTPQWRAGPLGSKTLCNACGVRFKSGRLFPEYRPACSPTFSSELHSNHHRKVLEMRRKKESSLPVQPEPGFDHMLESILV